MARRDQAGPIDGCDLEVERGACLMKTGVLIFAAMRSAPETSARAHIGFDVSYKRDVLEWNKVWGAERHRNAGSLLATTASIEPASNGNTMKLMVEPEFIRFEKQEHRKKYSASSQPPN